MSAQSFLNAISEMNRLIYERELPDHVISECANMVQALNDSIAGDDLGEINPSARLLTLLDVLRASPLKGEAPASKANTTEKQFIEKTIRVAQREGRL